MGRDSPKAQRLEETVGRETAGRKVQKTKNMVHLKNLEFYILRVNGPWD